MKILVGGIVAVLLLVGCAFLGGMAEREKMYGKEVPVITECFAPKQVSLGENWLVYINASDPDGDMSQFVCSIDQPFSPRLAVLFKSTPPDTPHHVAHTKIGKDQQKNLSGYLVLGTNVDHPINLTLTLQINDKAGHFSAPVTYLLHIVDPRNRKEIDQEAPPRGIFQEKNLGLINISLSADFG